MRTLRSTAVFLFTLVLLVSGCAINRTNATAVSDFSLNKSTRFYVVRLASDDRDVDKLIVDRLIKGGHIATSGPEQPGSYNADLVVTYKDKWRWDITMYMLELVINFRAPDNGFPLATGSSFHTSLTRKSPEEMVEEVLNSIFSKARQNQ